MKLGYRANRRKLIKSQRLRVVTVDVVSNPAQVRPKL